MDRTYLVSLSRGQIKKVFDLFLEAGAKILKKIPCLGGRFEDRHQKDILRFNDL